MISGMNRERLIYHSSFSGAEDRLRPRRVDCPEQGDSGRTGEPDVRAGSACEGGPLLLTGEETDPVGRPVHIFYY
jgi:hypothetical protein